MQLQLAMSVELKYLDMAMEKPCTSPTLMAIQRVYAHLQKFSPTIEAYVKKHQYSRETLN